MQHPFPAAFVSLQWLWWLPSQTINWWHGIRYPFEYNCRVSNDIEAPKALDVQLALPERGKFYLAAILNGGKKTSRQYSALINW